MGTKLLRESLFILTLVLGAACRDRSDFKVLDQKNSPSGQYKATFLVRSGGGAVGSVDFYLDVTDKASGTTERLAHFKNFTRSKVGSADILQWRDDNVLSIRYAQARVLSYTNEWFPSPGSFPLRTLVVLMIPDDPARSYPLE